MAGVSGEATDTPIMTTAISTATLAMTPMVSKPESIRDDGACGLGGGR